MGHIGEPDYTKIEALNENTSGYLKFIAPYNSNMRFTLANSSVTRVRIPKNLLNIDENTFNICNNL